MRKTLLVLLLIAVAGVIALLIVRPVLQEDLAAGSRAAQSGEQDSPPLRAELTESELAETPDPSAKRESAAPLLPETPTAISATDVPRSLLIVRVIGKVDRAPLAGVRANLWPQKFESGFSSEHVSRSKGTIHESLLTGSDGRLEFDVPTDTDLRLDARGEDGTVGDANVEVPGLRANERREIVVELAQGNDAHITGQVVTAEAETPIAGARVSLVQASQSFSSDTGRSWTQHPLAQATTNAEGTFEFRFASWKYPHLRIEAEGYGLRLVSPKQDENDAQRVLLVKLARACALDAHVLDASGKGIPGAWVVLDANGYALDRSDEDGNGFFIGGFTSLPDEQWKCETGADGGARVQGLPAGVGFVVEVRKDGKVLRHEADELKLVPGETREIEWRIGAGTRVSGLVLDQENQPVKGTEIWLEQCMFDQGFYFQKYEEERIAKKARTDDEGRFVLEDVPAGKWWIGPAAERDDWDEPDPAAVAPLADVITTSGEPARELTLHVFRGLYIRGTVLDPTGAPVANSYISADDEDSMTFGVSAQSGKDGSFAFGPIAAGTFTLTANNSGSFASSESVRARSGDTGVVLRLKLGASIRGHVLDAATGAGCQAQLTFSREQPGSGIFGTTMSTGTNADGSFKRDGFEPGRYGITAMTADGRFGQQAGIDVGAGAESGDIVLTLRPGGKLRLVYKGAKPGLIVSARCGGVLVGFGASLEPGKSKDLLMPSGALVLELSTHFEEQPRLKRVDLKPGETKEITLTDED